MAVIAIKLVQQGEDARRAQVINLATLIQDAAGVLQELQNKLRHAALNDATHSIDLRSLSAELSSVRENVDLLVSR